MIDSCREGDGCCGGGPIQLERRAFLKTTAAAALAMAADRPVMAGPFEENDYARLIPEDKKLDPAWVKSLFARGEPTVYRGKALETIGMPCGGICAGHVYLGGDGRLWLWDVFNRHGVGVQGKGQNGESYVKPAEPTSPFDQGFAVRVKAAGTTQTRTLDRFGFTGVTFHGEYPVATVEYGDPALPVTASLEAFSPFIPLRADDSGFPVTVMRFTVKNTGAAAAEVEVAGWLENAVCLHAARESAGTRRNRVVRSNEMLFLDASAEEPPRVEVKTPRPAIPFEDFEGATYENWTATGTAFGDGPIAAAEMPKYQGNVGAHGKRLVNSHNTRHGEDVAKGDAHVGRLTSKPFVIERAFIDFLVGGGAHEGKTCVNLLAGGKVVRTATGRNDNRLAPHAFDVGDLEGQTAVIEVVDEHAGGWGNIGLDDIVFTDEPRAAQPALRNASDFGTMGLALLDPRAGDRAIASIAAGKGVEGVFEALASGSAASIEASQPLGKSLRGAVSRVATLAPGEEVVASFLVAWHFPNLHLPGFANRVGRHYASRFDSARAVASHVARDFERLRSETLLWRDTWRDSTLPHWFLERTFANTSTLATSTCHRFEDGRFYGWEGVGCCEGTCTHVWHYAQAVARVFPELERDARERVDYGIAFDEATGLIGYRGELHRELAVDGQAGTVLRAYREHQMAPDARFLERLWPRVRKSIERLVALDVDGDGVIEGSQPNTLDAAWFGKIPWITSMYLAALRAGEAMAVEMGDGAFAARVREVFERGKKGILELWNGEFFVQVPDPKHMDAIGADAGCLIDQVLGQAWAFQVGLGRLYDEARVKSALRSLWKYNFAPDVGPFRAVFQQGRPYALAGDAGLVMCTWPKGGKRRDWEKHWQYMYFNECMSGFEHQVAAHMLWEGMLTEGMAVERAIHDRYRAELRNPYNEVECSDHYARAMASHGVFLAACGFEHHGPKGHIGFAPRLTPEEFRAPFTAAEGWGTYAQRLDARGLRASIAVRWGRLRLRSMSFALPRASSASVKFAGRTIASRIEAEGERVMVRLEVDVVIEAGNAVEVDLASG